MLFHYQPPPPLTPPLCSTLPRQQLSPLSPVICGSGAMEFVLPRGTSAANAPVPKSDAITVKDVPAEVLAVREFPGDKVPSSCPFLFPCFSRYEHPLYLCITKKSYFNLSIFTLGFPVFSVVRSLLTRLQLSDLFFSPQVSRLMVKCHDNELCWKMHC